MNVKTLTNVQEIQIFAKEAETASILPEVTSVNVPPVMSCHQMALSVLIEEWDTAMTGF